MQQYDCIVIGVGAMGSAACLSLARRGMSVLGIDAFQPPHDRGSSHGQTRIVRKAYFEHPNYVPLLHRAYPLWDALAAETGQPLMERVGLVLLGADTSEVLAGVRSTARQHQLAIEELSPSDVVRRFPMFRPPAGVRGLYEADAGFLRPELCVEQMIRLAAASGAAFRWNEPVRAWRRNDGIWVIRADTADFAAPRVVVTAGAWSGALLAELSLPLTPLRKVQLWFPADERYRPERGCPVFCADTAEGFYYGAPIVGDGVMKVAKHSGDDIAARPDMIDRSLHSADVEPVAKFIRDYLPGVRAAPTRHAVCMYAMTPDGHFIVDRHPEREGLVLAVGFSGHGFKFAPLIGEIVADLVERGDTEYEIGFLSLARDALRGRG